MNDIVERLRSRSAYDGWSTEDVLSGEAADTIEALRAENARLYEWKDKAGDMDRVKTVELVDLRAENTRLKDVVRENDAAFIRVSNENARLRELLKECADDMEAEYKAKYGFVEGDLPHPVEQRLYERDMVLVHAARAAVGDTK